ncbi:MAG: hypothetical protein HC929_15710 [Leptolyngbyaceae cyanobacterium SM2_5_2]|nr:hypothetical protein [Leptolyngbyaceae cyanobacterium SM2_5_2]
MGRLVERIKQRLARFEFAALFRDELGWDMPSVDGNPQRHPLRQCLAHQGSSWVWLRAEWTPELQGGDLLLLQETMPGEAGADPLIIAVTADATRSLWCWQTGATDSPVWRTRVMVRGQEDGAWASQLARLHHEHWGVEQRLASALNGLDIPLTPEHFSGFHQSWQALSQALTPLPDVAARRRYGLCLLLRLVAMAALQQRRYLNNDEWYLHNLFGQSQQRGRDRFFSTVCNLSASKGFRYP